MKSKIEKHLQSWVFFIWLFELYFVSSHEIYITGYGLNCKPSFRELMFQISCGPIFWNIFKKLDIQLKVK